MAITIRRAGMADYEAVCRLYAEGDALHAQLLPDRFQPANPARDAAFFAERTAGYPAALFLAELDGVPVGLLELRFVELPDLPPIVRRTYLSVESLVVAAQHRRSGIGALLLEHAESVARERGVGDVELNVFALNDAAVRLYEKRGYRVLSMRMHRRFDPVEDERGLAPAQAARHENEAGRAAQQDVRPAD